MVGIFKIKKERKSLKSNNNNIFSIYDNISKFDINQALSTYDSNINGLLSDKAKQKLKIDGLNEVIKDNKKSWFYYWILSFKDTFIIILFILAVINFIMGEELGSMIIVLMVCIGEFI